MDGDYINILTDFGLAIQSDGNNINQITLPDEYASLMGGICANADYTKHNDYRLKVSPVNGCDLVLRFIINRIFLDILILYWLINVKQLFNILINTINSLTYMTIIYIYI